MMLWLLQTQQKPLLDSALANRTSVFRGILNRTFCTQNERTPTRSELPTNGDQRRMRSVPTREQEDHVATIRDRVLALAGGARSQRALSASSKASPGSSGNCDSASKEMPTPGPPRAVTRAISAVWSAFSELTTNSP